MAIEITLDQFEQVCKRKQTQEKISLKLILVIK